MPDRSSDTHAVLRAVTATARPALLGVGVLSAAAALLPVTAAGMLAMVLDVVLASRAGATLAALLALSLLVLGTLAVLRGLRDRALAQLGDVVALRLHAGVDAAVARGVEGARAPGDGLQAQRDLDAIRAALAGGGGAALADLPAAAFALILAGLLHGYLALALAAAIAVAGALTLSALRRAAAAGQARTQALADRNLAADTGYRHAALVRVLGMGGRAAAVRAAGEQRLVAADAALVAGTARALGLVRAIRLVAWAGVLALAGWLAITGRASAGVVAAAALLADRALAPFEAVVARAPDLALGRIGWRRLSALLAQAPVVQPPLALSAPTADLSVEAVSLLAPLTRRVVLRDIGLSLKAGEMLSVVGPSGAGKSALIHALAGGWAPAAGKVRLDGGALDQWDPADLGRHIGYLPQAPELFDGTVEQNIARFDPDATSDSVIAAARAAGVHDLIVRLPQGYATEVGPGGSLLPYGQRQRLALARALYGDPFLLLLDDPAAFADARGQAALTAALTAAKARGAVIVATGPAHASLEPSDYLLVLANGQAQDFGRKQDVRGRLARRQKSRAAARAPRPIAAPAPEPAVQE